MWTTLAHGFLYVYTGMVAGVTGSVLVATNQIIGTAADWVLPCDALIERSLATYYATNALATTNMLMVRVTWESNPSSGYVRSEVTNWGATNGTCVTNFFTNQYLYGRQEYAPLARYDEPNGFDVAATSTPWFKMANYRVSPLLWGGGRYTADALTNTVPTVLASFSVAGQAGRYIYNWETNDWPYYVTNLTTNWTGTNSVVVTNVTSTNVPPIWVTSQVDRVFLDYNPTNQRPNAITPLMGRSHLLALDAKLAALAPYYYDDAKAVGGTFDNYCATAGVYWVSNYYVGAIWFDAPNIMSATTQTWSYYSTTWDPAKEISTIVTTIVAGTSSNYTYITNIPYEVAGTEGDHDREETVAGTSSTNVEGWATRQVSAGGTWGTETLEGWLSGTEADHTKVTTNILTSSNGVEGSVSDYNGTKYSYTNLIGTPFATGLVGGAATGAGSAGEIDYHLEEITGQETNWARRVYIDTTEGTIDDYTSLTTSNHTEPGTADHYNRTTYRDRHDRVLIWAGVSNILAEYMTPWVVDHTNNWTSGNSDYYDRYLFNYGWSPSYSNGDWRVYSDSTSVAGTNYFFDWTTTNYWHANYEYFKNNTNEDATSWHYNRWYQYYWKYPEEYTYYKWGTFESPKWIPGFATEWYGNYTNYYKSVDSNYYKLQLVTTNWVVKEPLYTIKYQVFPAAPPLWALTNFQACYSNLLSPAYLSETQSVLSNTTVTITNEGVVYSWTKYYTTNIVSSYPAVYSNAWAVSLWADSFKEKYKAITSLVWTASGATIESVTRTLSTTNPAAAGWTTQPITTNLSGGTYSSSIYTYWPGWPGYRTFTFSKTCIRAKRLAPAPMDGAIDTYLKFGGTLSGRYDVDGIGYPFGPYVRVVELYIAAGDVYSDWLGDIAEPPAFPDLDDYTYHHPWGFTIQCASGAPTYVFKPEFD